MAAVKKEGGWGEKKKVKGLISKMRNLIDTDNSMVITIGKGGWEGRREEEVKGRNKREGNSDGRRIDLGW